MKKMIAISALALTTFAFAPPAAQAGGLRKDWVAADAEWVVHVDMEAFVASKIGQAMLDEDDPIELNAHFDELKNELGLDPRTDVMSVTAWGSGTEDDEQGVIVAVTSDRVEAALDGLREKDAVDVDTIEIAGREVHVISDDDEHLFVHVRRTSRDDRRVLLLSDGKDAMRHALRVLENETPSLEAGGSALAKRAPREGSIVYASVTDVSRLPEMEAASQIVKLSDAITVDVSEREGVLHGSASISADTTENARNIADVVQGLIALGRLMAGGDDEFRQLTDAVRIDADGRVITIGLQIETDALIGAMEHLEDGFEAFDDFEFDDLEIDF